MDEWRLTQAIGAFWYDALFDPSATIKLWRSPTDRKSYRARAKPNKRVRPSDVLAHLRGEIVAAGGPAQRCLVIDHDLEGVESGDEAEEASKAAAGLAVSALLDSFGVPHVHFDGARGCHTWIRLHRNATSDELAAISRLLNGADRHPLLAETRATFEVFPAGNRALRLPLGRYLGKPRHAIPPMTDDGYLSWLTSPPRATDAQLAAVLRAAALPAANRPPSLAPPAAATSRTARAEQAESPSLHDLPAAPASITGWEKWPECKRAVALSGPQPGQRHRAALALANEAVTSGERHQGRLVDFLLAVPRPHSKTPQAEHEKDAQATASAALRLHEENDPRRFSGCPHVPVHSGRPETQGLREVFEHECTEERAAACPILRRWHSEQNLPAYWHIIRSSIWRDGRGNGTGLGLQAKEIYKEMLRLSRGDPALIFEASTRYLALNTGLARTTVRRARGVLCQLGLAEAVDVDRAWYRVPFHPVSWIKEREAELGTAAIEARQRQEILTDWRKYAAFKRGQNQNEASKAPS